MIVIYCKHFPFRGYKVITPLQYRDWHKAYHNISFEREAYANQYDLSYTCWRMAYSWKTMGKTKLKIRQFTMHSHYVCNPYDFRAKYSSITNEILKYCKRNMRAS